MAPYVAQTSFEVLGSTAVSALYLSRKEDVDGCH